MTLLSRSLLVSLLLPGCYLSHTVAGVTSDASTPRDLSSSPDLSSRVDLGSPCRPAAANGDAIRQDCVPDHSTCPTGYTCAGHSGAILDFSCEILCPTDCECPADTTCSTFMDKAGPHRYCIGMPILI